MAKLTQLQSRRLEELGFNEFCERSPIMTTINDDNDDIDGTFNDNSFNSEKIENLKVNKLLSGIIYSQQIQLGITDTKGDVYIAGGTYTPSTWTANSGFILGLDDSDSNKAKFFIGNTSNSLDWNVTTADTLTVIGTISGSTIIGGSLHIPDINTTANSFHVETDGDSWWGCTQTNWTADHDNANAYVLSTGVAQFKAVTIKGSSSIAGWNVIDSYIYNLQSGTPTSSPNDGVVLASGNEALIVYEDTAKRIELGYLSSGVYGLKGYATNGTDVVFELSDTQQKIAGWYFDTTTLADNTTAANAKIYIDSANTLIRAGATTGNYLTLDGANLRLRSSNYVSGFAGSGFTLEPDLLEVGNIACRGLFRTYVLQKDILSVNAGSLIVAPNADVLDADMTALDASTLTIKGTAIFAVGDIIRIKDGTDDEWLEVTNVASAPIYTVTRDKAGVYGADTNPTWKKGASVVNYGASGDGGLYLTASDTNSPYLSIYTHAGSPWSTITTQLRIGNLNGYLGYASDVYGFGAGSSSGTNANITIDTTNGIRLRKGTTNSITLDNSGNITVGEVGSGLANTYISSGALSIRLNTTALFSIDTSGNVLVGQTGSSQSNVYITSGAIYLRNNTTNKITLDASGNISLTGDLSVGSSGSIYFNNSTFGQDGIQLQYNAGSPRCFIGNSTNYFQFDGTTLEVTDSRDVQRLTAGEDITSGDSVQVGYTNINSAGTGSSLIPTHDSYTSSANPATNYGTATTMLTRSGASILYSWIKFALTGVPTTNLASATLYIYANAAGVAGTQTLTQVTGADWDESTITYNNQPTVGDSMGSFSAAGGGGQWYNTTLTLATVQGWLNGSIVNYGVRMDSSDSGSNSTWDTSEGTNPPYLLLVYNTGKVFKASAINSTNTNRWIGFATETQTSDSSIKIAFSKLHTTSGLTSGSIYYQSDTRGAISTSAGTVSKKIGVAVSTTKLLILNS